MGVLMPKLTGKLETDARTLAIYSSHFDSLPVPYEEWKSRLKKTSQYKKKKKKKND